MNPIIATSQPSATSLNPPPSPILAASSPQGKLPLDTCKSLHSPAELIPTRQQQFASLEQNKDSFSKGAKALELLNGFKILKDLSSEDANLLDRLINTICIPLCKQGFIQKDSLKTLEDFQDKIKTEHLSPNIKNLFVLTEEDRIATYFSQFFKQDQNFPLYDLNVITSLLADHIQHPSSANFLRFIESYLLEPSLYNHGNSRPLLDYFLRHFVERAHDYHTEIHRNAFNPTDSADDVFLNITLTNKHLACCLELYSDGSLDDPDANTTLQCLLAKALCHLTAFNNRLWILLMNGTYHIDSLIYTLSTQLEFSHLLSPEILQEADKELDLITTGLAGTRLDASILKEGAKKRLSTLSLAFRYGIRPLTTAVKDEAVADQIDAYLKTV